MRDIINIVESAEGELSFSKNQLNEVIRIALEQMCIEITERHDGDSKFDGFWRGSQQLNSQTITKAVCDFLAKSS